MFFKFDRKIFNSLYRAKDPFWSSSNNYSEAQQALHGNSILTEEADSPSFKVCDYKGKISEQQTFKMRLEKTKPKSSNGIGFENGAYKMDNLGQYFNTFIKVQVLALNHQCNVRSLNLASAACLQKNRLADRFFIPLLLIKTGFSGLAFQGRIFDRKTEFG